VAITDAEALTRALGSILPNAVRLAPGRSEVKVAFGSQPGWAWVAVRDEGPGIAPEDQGRVFDRFGRTCEVDDHDGHGLGLAIPVRQAEVRHHH
jgi:signal transduction histidine kinase